MITLVKTVSTYLVFMDDRQYTIILENEPEKNIPETIEILDEKGNYIKNDILFNEIENYFSKNYKIY